MFWLDNCAIRYNEIGYFHDYNWTYTPQEDNITVCTDINNTVDESNETNKCTTKTWKCGDVNGDGVVAMSDALAIVFEDLNCCCE